MGPGSWDSSRQKIFSSAIFSLENWLLVLHAKQLPEDVPLGYGTTKPIDVPQTSHVSCNYSGGTNEMEEQAPKISQKMKFVESALQLSDMTL